MTIDRKKNRPGSRLLLLQLTVFSVTWLETSNASDVYKWTGDDGVVHYSDTRPKDDVDVTTLQIEGLNSEDYDPATDPYSIVNQAIRVNESWRERVAAQHQAKSWTSRAREERRYASPPYAPFSYYRATSYYPVVPLLRETRRNPGAARRQFDALDALNLAGQRPASINSGVHRERVLRSRALPTVRPGGSSSFVVAP